MQILKNNKKKLHLPLEVIFTHSTVDNVMGNGYNDIVKKIAKNSSTKTKNNKITL